MSLDGAPRKLQSIIGHLAEYDFGLSQSVTQAPNSLVAPPLASPQNGKRKYPGALAGPFLIQRYSSPPFRQAQQRSEPPQAATWSGENRQLCPREVNPNDHHVQEPHPRRLPRHGPRSGNCKRDSCSSASYTEIKTFELVRWRSRRRTTESGPHVSFAPSCEWSYRFSIAK